MNTIERMGDDTFCATSNRIAERSNGDIFQCTASNGVSSDPTNIVELKGLLLTYKSVYYYVYYSPVARAPNITSVERVETSARVQWRQPSGGANVTGYRVHYRDENTGIEKSIAAASATISDIPDLINDHTYTFLVEATSEHLSGLSDIVTVAVGKNIKGTI